MASKLAVLGITIFVSLLTEGAARDGREKVASPYPKFPLFRQCDPKWAGDLMGLKTCTTASCPGARIGRDTICHQGGLQLAAALVSWAYVAM